VTLEAARELGPRLRRAAARPESLGVAALSLLAGAVAARAVVHALPSEGADVAAARALGIVSVSILQGHSKSAETLAYFAGVASALGASLALYCAWALRAGRGVGAPLSTSFPTAKRVTALELALVSLVFVAGFARFASAPGASIGTWVVLAEEGEMLAWVDTVLRGGVLSRDVFCLYGPLSIWPVALLFRALGPSLVIWRRWIFTVSAASLVAVYLLLRGLMRSRSGAFAATAVVAFVCTCRLPAMSWSLARVGLGLAALACLCRAFGASAPRWLAATGALLGVTLLYSQEVGVTCAVGVATALLLRPDRVRAFGWTTLGGVALLAPFVAYIAARGALGATVDNLFLFPRTRVLGFGGLPFPALQWTAASLRAYWAPAVLVTSGFATATKLFSGERSARVATELALLVFGLLLFAAALSRPDDTHLVFALPPALVLLALWLEDACYSLTSRSAPRARRVAAALGLALGAAALAPWASIVAESAPSLVAGSPAGYRELALPRAGGALFPDGFARDLEAIVREIQLRSAPDEPIWIFPNEALLYFLADRPQPTRFPLALFAVTRAQRLELVDELERSRPRWAVVCRYAPVVDEIAYDVALPEVLEYLRSRYELEGNFGAFALLRRKS
jgi:hypothetical protein